MTGPYDDIIHLPRPKSMRHVPMPRSARAAQFASFAALVGHSAAISETARRTDAQIELDETELAALNEKLRLLAQYDRPEAAITCFFPDEKKAGGEYRTIQGNIFRIDATAQTVVMEDGSRLKMAAILAIESPLLDLSI